MPVALGACDRWCCSPGATRSGQHLGRLDLAESRTQKVQTLYERADEVRELVDRRVSLQQRLWSLLVEAFHPRGDGGCGQMKDACGLSQRPAAGRAQLEDGEEFGGQVMGTLSRRDSGQASILDPAIFAKESNFVFELIDRGGHANALVAAVSGPTSGGYQDEMGQGHDLEDGGLNRTRPMFGERRPTTA